MTNNYNMNTLTREELKDLIGNADDNYNTQIRVWENGDIYISRTVGAEDIEGLRFRFESFDAGNGYVGQKAANDPRYIDETYQSLKECWKQGRTGYIDY